MKTKILLALLALLLGTAAFTDAAVLVYRGSCRVMQGDATLYSPRTYATHLVLDTTTVQGNMVFVDTKRKTLFIQNTIAYGISEVGPTGKKTVLLSTASANYVNARNYMTLFARYGGRMSALQVLANNPAAIFNMPRVLSGVYSQISSTPYAMTGTMALGYRKTETQLANGSGKSVANVLFDIRAALLQKGYVDVTPP